eukprot:GHVU01066558.1.p1 GENE.GHVU01066558.1~~GHVU01066558.1.p1  ORF type:complete len:225 (+),score=2.01 GHVU01066558.1:277-951(+)
MVVDVFVPSSNPSRRTSLLNISSVVAVSPYTASTLAHTRADVHTHIHVHTYTHTHRDIHTQIRPAIHAPADRPTRMMRNYFGTDSLFVRTCVESEVEPGGSQRWATETKDRCRCCYFGGWQDGYMRMDELMDGNKHRWICERESTARRPPPLPPLYLASLAAAPHTQYLYTLSTVSPVSGVPQGQLGTPLRGPHRGAPSETSRHLSSDSRDLFIGRHRTMMTRS